MWETECEVPDARGPWPCFFALLACRPNLGVGRQPLEGRALDDDGRVLAVRLVAGAVAPQTGKKGAMIRP